MKIPFTDRSISESSPTHNSILSAISRIMQSGQYVMGAHIEKFEKRLAEVCGCRYAVGVNSGTDALFLTMIALGIGTGDEVIVPSNAFWAVANSVSLTDARAIFCDVRYEDMLIDPEKIKPLINDKTKAIIPVHLTGMPCEMDEINDIANKHGLFVVEDAAQAIGAQYKGKKAGSLGIAGCFSFHPLKNIHALGDGGAVVTNDTELYGKILELRNHGLRDGKVFVPGFNSRLDEIHAAAINIQIDSLDEIIEFKRATAAVYDDAFRPFVNINEEPGYNKSVYQLYMIKTPERDGLSGYLADNGIGTSIHYRDYVAFHPYYRKLAGSPPNIPVTERLSNDVLSLPIFNGMGDKEINHVIATISGYFRGKGFHTGFANDQRL